MNSNVGMKCRATWPRCPGSREPVGAGRCADCGREVRTTLAGVAVVHRMPPVDHDYLEDVLDMAPGDSFACHILGTMAEWIAAETGCDDCVQKIRQRQAAMVEAHLAPAHIDGDR